MLKIAVEEAFITPGVAEACRDFIHKGAPGEMGLDYSFGRVLNATSGWGAKANERLLDLGELRIAEMDAGGIDMQVLALTAPGVQIFDADTGHHLAVEANDILAEAVRAHPNRFAGLAAVAPQAPISSAKEIERAKSLGLKGVIINSHTKGEYLDGPGYRPLLEAAAANNMPIYLHPRPSPPAMYVPFYERHMDSAMWGFQTETGMHALRLILTGVFDDLPDLQIVLGHLGEGIPFWLDRMDRVYVRSVRSGFYPQWTAKEPVSHYFLKNFFVTSSGHNWDPALRFVEEVVGVDRLMFAADYPYEENRQQVDQAAAVDLKDPEKFYEGNARRVFNLT
ncbi:amidohydrolase family protein [Pusillimonas sp.]|uniref:amidohydrolase family protein n=1 Tax=Pusillimonas sp. TaxID=3040095 RepID=UPI0029BB9F22|nr:amidohydrolase family protein [Pusillimonas sp.]MDX3894210.1 amidohydrolase family protein [Pusillimonas sp.]